jgi:hypothetical protein
VAKPVIILGAELQPAVSMAMSRPDLRFLFISERDVVDGWDLKNVEIKRTRIESFAPCVASESVVALSPRWLCCIDCDAAQYALSHVLNRLADAYSQWILPVSRTPMPSPWVLKGDLCHRPDAVLDGRGEQLAEGADPYGCVNVYQRRIVIAATTLAMGRRADAKNCALGLVRILSEAFAREDFLIAGESVNDDEIERRSRTLLDALDYTGFYSMNWVTDQGGKSWLTSFRPIPRALFQLFCAAGVDLLKPPKGFARVRAGHRFIVDYHYASYQ